jgi:Cu(I)/Ag(I) efflux system membrane fusion protein
MPLSLRKKGQPMQLPPGVVGRVSLNANRVRMAGIGTSEIGIRSMAQSIRTVGNVVYDEGLRTQIVSRVSGYVEKLFVDRTFTQVNKGDALAEIYSPELYAALEELRVANGVSGSNLSKIAREKIRLLGINDSEIDALLKSDNDGTRIKVQSPSSGIVIQKAIQQGANVATGQMLFEIVDLSTVWIEAEVFERDLAILHLNQDIEATVEAYPQDVFKGRVSLIYPELTTATRTNRVRFEVANPDNKLRSGMYATVKIETPLQKTEPFASVMAAAAEPAADQEQAIAKQSVCPVTHAKLGSMGPPVLVSAKGQNVYLCCTRCEPTIKSDPDKYLSQIQTVSNEGVLAVPESAVIDTGSQKVVYVEREEGTYEGVEVQLGPRNEGYYAVIAGLHPGDKVATAGAFLIDAETRLNPAASASYFGASGSPGVSQNTSDSGASDALATQGNVPEESPKNDEATAGDSVINYHPSRLTAQELKEISELSQEDQELAKQQVLCPVTLESLGSMGKPLKMIVKGEVVFICCKACIKRLKKDQDAMLEMALRWREANKQPQEAAK